MVVKWTFNVIRGGKWPFKKNPPPIFCTFLSIFFVYFYIYNIGFRLCMDSFEIVILFNLLFCSFYHFHYLIATCYKFESPSQIYQSNREIYYSLLVLLLGRRGVSKLNNFYTSKHGQFY